MKKGCDPFSKKIKDNRKLPTKKKEEKKRRRRRNWIRKEIDRWSPKEVN